MIAIPGLCLVTGRLEDAKKILRAFAKSLHKGLLPDRLPEKGEEPEYTSADASLWLFVAAWKYLQATDDEAFVRETLLPALRKIVHVFDRGTLHGIKVDADGLLSTGVKMVEVDALWYNALAILAEIETRAGDPEEAKRLRQRAKRVQKRFQETSWDEEPGHVFALSLPFPLLPKANAVKVLAAIEGKLDQGTVWPSLLGPYLTALVRVHGATGRKKALSILEALKPRLAEADAQAWSVAEVLRAYVEDLQGGKPEVASKKRAPKKSE